MKDEAERLIATALAMPELWRRRIVERLSESLPPTDTHSILLAAIATDPTAIEPRLMLADYLEEQGDPVGEWVRDDVWYAEISQKLSWEELENADPERHRRYMMAGGRVRGDPRAWWGGGGPVKPLWLCRSDPEYAKRSDRPRYYY